MKTGRSLIELAEELERQQEVRKDFVADTRQLRMVTNEVPEGMPPLRLAVEGHGAYEPNDWTHRQIAQRTGIHAAYYDKMRDQAPSLLARNVNHWWQAEPENRMVRTLDQGVRAFVSDVYRPLDSVDLMEVALPILSERGFETKSAEITERKFYLKVVSPRIEGEAVVGRPVQMGLVITNSEVGAGAVNVSELIYELICKNGMVVSKALRQAHLGRGRSDSIEDLSEHYTQRTRRVDDAAFWLKFRDVLNAICSQERFDAILGKLSDAHEDSHRIADPIEAVKVVTAKFKLRDGERKGILRSLVEGGDLSRYGMIQAITATAESVDSYDRASELEELGGRVLELPRSEWKRIAEAA